MNKIKIFLVIIVLLSLLGCSSATIARAEYRSVDCDETITNEEPLIEGVRTSIKLPAEYK